MPPRALCVEWFADVCWLVVVFSIYGWRNMFIVLSPYGSRCKLCVLPVSLWSCAVLLGHQ